MKKFKVSPFFFACLLLSGCVYDTTSVEKAGEVSGCEVSKVKLKGEDYPIFIAKCQETVTTTSSHTVSAGKSSRRVDVATITTVERDQDELIRKQQALDKLSDDDKQVLGLK